MERHAVDDGGHGQLAHTGVEESALEVAAGEGGGVLEEGVGLVAVGQVGARHDHIAHVAGQGRQHVGAGGTRSEVGLVLDGGVVHVVHLAGDVAVEFRGQLGVGFTPLFFLLAALRHDGFELLLAVAVELCHLGEHLPGVLRVAAQVLNGFLIAGAALAQRVAVCAALALEILSVLGDASASHDGAPNDDGGAFLLAEGLLEGLCDGLRVGAVDFEHVPVPGAVFHCRVLVAHGVAVG